VLPTAHEQVLHAVAQPLPEGAAAIPLELPSILILDGSHLPMQPNGALSDAVLAAVNR
jgi:hypothetical protein